MPDCETLRQHLCADVKCAEADFTRELFRLCRPRKVAWVAWLLGGIDGKFLAPDRMLIEQAGNAIAMEELQDAIDDFSDRAANGTWLRHVVGLRISTRRLRRLAGDYLPLSRPERRKPRGPTSR